MYSVALKRFGREWRTSYNKHRMLQILHEIWKRESKISAATTQQESDEITAVKWLSCIVCRSLKTEPGNRRAASSVLRKTVAGPVKS